MRLLFGSRGRSLALESWLPPRGEKQREEEKERERERRKTEVEHSITTRIIAP